MEAPPVDESLLDGEWYILVPVGCQQSVRAHASCLSIQLQASQLPGTVLELIELIPLKALCILAPSYIAELLLLHELNTFFFLNIV